MKIGILSDTHGRVDSARLGIEALVGRGAEMLVHCGDVGSPEVLDLLVGQRSLFVFGNCDWDRETLRRHAQIIGVPCQNAYADLELDGKRLAIIHGDDAGLKRRILAEQQHDYLLQGHTHMRDDVMVGRTRLINPGALHRANPRTVALLDLASGALEFIEIAGG
ncbi:MAG: metallophosphoesterase family protein [Tepidisphaerales bacterium]